MGQTEKKSLLDQEIQSDKYSMVANSMEQGQTVLFYLGYPCCYLLILKTIHLLSPPVSSASHSICIGEGLLPRASPNLRVVTSRVVALLYAMREMTQGLLKLNNHVEPGCIIPHCHSKYLVRTRI
jgi:hypothetical protein